MAKKLDFKKDLEWGYRRNLLEALLVSSVSKESFRLPTIKEFILNEVVNGTIEYIGGNAGQIDYKKFRFDRNTFEIELERYFEAEMKAYSKEKLNPKVNKAITKLCKHYFVYPTGPDRPYPHTELYTHFNGFGAGICPVIMESSFSLPQDTIIRVQRKVLPALSNPEKKDIEGIGKAMRKYIDRDLEFIERTYHW